MAARVQRIEFDHPAERRSGGRQLSGLALRDAEQAQCVGIAGLQLGGNLKLSYAVCGAPLPSEHLAQVCVSRTSARLEANNFGEVGFGLVELIERRVRAAE